MYKYIIFIRQKKWQTDDLVLFEEYLSLLLIAEFFMIKILGICFVDKMQSIIQLFKVLLKLNGSFEWLIQDYTRHNVTVF